MKKFSLFSALIKILTFCCWSAPGWDLAEFTANEIKVADLQIKLPGSMKSAKVRAGALYMTMPDKTRLFTLIATPAGKDVNGKYPVIFIRTCYQDENATDLKQFCKLQAEVLKQAPPNSRQDIISFISEPFEKPLKVRGNISAVINVKSDCEDTAFYLRLSIVKNNVAYSLREDINTIADQHPDYRPGTVVPMKFNFIKHAFMLEKGDRLRLDISSACWPTFLPHTNIKGDRFYQTSVKKANNTIEFANSSITFNILP